MKCIHCGLENPKQSKFCRKCGTPLGVPIKCPQCGSNNPGDSLFCIVCGARLSGIQKSAKGARQKCRYCGGLNEVDALFCVVCGGQIIRVPKENLKRKSDGPSFKTICLVIGAVLLIAVLIKAGTTFFKAESHSGLSSLSAPVSRSINVDEAQVIDVAKHFKCACGRCGELPLATCNCDMPMGSVEEKRFIRERLAEGYTVGQVIELLDKKYGHRV